MPWQIPPSGWRDALVRVLLERVDDRLSASAAAAAFYATLSMFPALLAVVSIYGLFFDPSQVADHLAQLRGLIPEPALDLGLQYLAGVAGQGGGELTVSLVVGILGGLWGASRGTRALVGALNLAYGERERRGLVVRILVGVALTATGTITVAGAVVLVAVVPAVVALAGLESDLARLIAAGRLAAMTAGVIAYLLVLYRFGPSRTRARWAWVTPGAVLGALAWLAASSLFTAWVASFGRYDATYGALGTVVVLMLWLYMGAWIITTAGALNAELERQTFEDTTRGAPRPLGQRGAWAADDVAGRPPPLWRAVLKGERDPVAD